MSVSYEADAFNYYFPVGDYTEPVPIAGCISAIHLQGRVAHNIYQFEKAALFGYIYIALIQGRLADYDYIYIFKV